MKNVLLLVCLFVLSSAAVTAGDANKKTKSTKHTCTYTGTVLDAANAEAMTGATVRIVEIDREAFADFDGKFTFEEIPAGTYTLEISFVSYETKTIELFTIEQDTKSKRFLL